MKFQVDKVWHVYAAGGVIFTVAALVTALFQARTGTATCAFFAIVDWAAMLVAKRKDL